MKYIISLIALILLLQQAAFWTLDREEENRLKAIKENRRIKMNSDLKWVSEEVNWLMEYHKCNEEEASRMVYESGYLSEDQLNYLEGK